MRRIRAFGQKLTAHDFTLNPALAKVMATAVSACFCAKHNPCNPSFYKGL
jgi:hypothetical protein